MKELTDERVAAFLAELTELTRKHHIVIWGCGCCGSPGLAQEDTPQAGEYTTENEDNEPHYLRFRPRKPV